MSSDIKAGGVDVQEVMREVRAAIAEKKARGLLTDEEIREIAEYRLEPVLGAHDLKSGLLHELLEGRDRWNYTFDAETVYRSSRGGVGSALERVRRWLRPVQKLFWNPTPMISALSRQSDLNTTVLHLLHNVCEQATRLQLEVTDLRNRLLQLQGRLEMQVRREKALEALLAERGEVASSGRAERLTTGSASRSIGGTAGAGHEPGLLVPKPSSPQSSAPPRDDAEPHSIGGIGGAGHEPGLLVPPNPPERG